MIKKLIGNTPMIKINYEYKGKRRYIYTKLEYYNLTGSIKDRVAYYIINHAKKNGLLKDNMPIIEATSGNTGISLSALGRYYGHRVYIFMPDWVSNERVNLMRSFGAEVNLISKSQGGFIKCVEEARKFANENNGFLANQFENIDNILAHYETTGVEISKQINEEVGGFISGVGTGGTLVGTGLKLREKYKNIKIFALEPDKMPIISKGEIIDNHKIEGIGDDFVPDILKKNINIIEDIFLINDEDAINMSRLLARKLGLGVGISSGANLIGAILSSEKVDNPVVTVFADDNKKYLSTDLIKDIDNNNEFISNNVNIIGYDVI